MGRKLIQWFLGFFTSKKEETPVNPSWAPHDSIAPVIGSDIDVDKYTLGYDPFNDEGGSITVSTKVLPEPSNFIWILDAGHGELTKGKQAPLPVKGNLFREYEFNRDIVRKIADGLDNLGISYHILVPETNCGNLLKERVKRVNELKTYQQKILVSVHSNAYGLGPTWSNPSGIEVWHQNEKDVSIALAETFLENLVQYTGWRNRGIRFRTGNKEFYLLRNVQIPAILTENGFYTNETECTQLLTNYYRQKIADAHVMSIVKVEELSKKTQANAPITQLKEEFEFDDYSIMPFGEHKGTKTHRCTGKLPGMDL